MSANFERELRRQAREDVILMAVIAAVSFGLGAIGATLLGVLS